MAEETFGGLLRIYRRNARDSVLGGPLSQSRLADLLSEESGIIYSRAAVSDWERGKGQIHKDARYLLVCLIKVLHRSGGIANRAEADEWLAIGNYRALSAPEVAQIDEAWTLETKLSLEEEKKDPTVIFMPPMLPPQPIIGRAQLLAQLKEILFDGRSLALSAINGLPGIGKTALAVLLAHDADIRERFEDGVLWAGLGPNPDIFALLGSWADAVGISPDETARLGAVRLRADAIHETIRDRRMLLVIDDVWEHEHALPFKLGGAKCAHVLTSRQPPIAAGFAGPHALTVGELSLEQGLNLLRWLAPSVVDQEPDAALDLVRASGGLPLALILIGNELRMYGVTGSERRIRAALEALQQTEKRLLLAQEASIISRETYPSLPHNTAISLSAVISISETRLSAEGRRALRALALFPPKPNSFSEEAALAVANTSTDTLDSLVDHGLLESVRRDRYTLHQSIYDYARLDGLEGGARERLAIYYHAFVAAQEPGMGEIELEVDNINAALQEAVNCRQRDLLWSLIDALMPFFDDKGHYEPAQTLLRQLDEQSTKVEPALKLYRGRFAVNQGDRNTARELWEAGLAAAREDDNSDTTITLLSYLSILAGEQGEYAVAGDYLDEAVTSAQSLSNWEEVSRALGNMGQLAYMRDAYDEADQFLNEALSIARTHDLHSLTSGVLNLLGLVAQTRGRQETALEHLRDGLAIAREHRFAARTSTLLVNIGQLMNEMERYQEANAYLEEGLDLARQLGNRAQESHLLMDLGVATAGQDNFTLANAYLAEAHALAKEIGNKWLVAYTAVHWGTAAVQQGDLERAAFYLEEALALAPEVSPKAEIVGLGNFGLARIALESGDNVAADQYSSKALAALADSNRRRAAEVRAWRDVHNFAEEQESPY
ncbi:MAG: ATP-binding protein [Candidatus Promineifilaceae bacterium]